jgi:hypothetical protein
MAIIKLINSKSQQTNASMKKCINYAKKLEQENGLVTGINCGGDTALEEFKLIKKMYHKEKGRMYIHMEQSFPPDPNITAKQVHQIGLRLINESEVFNGFQIVVGTHTDQEHLHNHFCINSVNREDGKKWHISNQDVNNIREKSIALCSENNIELWWAKEKSQSLNEDKLYTTKQGEWEKQKNGSSWKYELFLAVKESTKHAHSQEEFISNMEKLNYGVRWDYHKYILFTTPGGRKCRNNKLYPVEKFTKENLLKQFDGNAERRSDRTKQQHQKEMEETANAVKNILGILKSQNKQGKDDYLPLTEHKKSLEGEALKEKMKNKENSSYNWELY